MADGINGADKFPCSIRWGIRPRSCRNRWRRGSTAWTARPFIFVDPRFDDSGLFLRQVQDWFAEHMPSVKTKLVEMSSVYTKDDPKTWEMIKANGDGAIIGVGH